MIVDSDRVNVSSLMRTQGLNQRSHQPLFELRTEKPSSQATELEPRPHVSYPIVPTINTQRTTRILNYTEIRVTLVP